MRQQRRRPTAVYPGDIIPEWVGVIKTESMGDIIPLQVGGFTGIRKVARAARERHKRVITHGYKTNIEIAANLHFLANHWTAELLEYSTSKSPLRWDTTEERIDVGADGAVTVPRSPGLGVHLNERTVEKYRVS